MEKDFNCAYCARTANPSLYQKFGYFVCHLAVSDLYVFREQSHLGRCIVAYKDHVSEIIDIPKEERQAFLEDIALVAKALHLAFSPDKLDYGFYGDTGHHLHCHICPKYKDQFEWGSTFAMDPNLNKKTDGELKIIADIISANLI